MSYDPARIAADLTTNQQDAWALAWAMQKDEKPVNAEQEQTLLTARDLEKHLRALAVKAAEVFEPLTKRDRFDLELAILRAYTTILAEGAMSLEAAPDAH